MQNDKSFYLTIKAEKILRTNVIEKNNFEES